MADGRGRIIDVRADDQIDEASAQAFEAGEREPGRDLDLRRVRTEQTDGIVARHEHTCREITYGQQFQDHRTADIAGSGAGQAS
ncbi:hypothetical protein ACQP25_29600 [Microtetraspora malaysiensis]|uniref:hypothetical protein n=1 Tax=Microtetraspora malaysiensis TaxID=161358 RepID=UPI003D8F7843